MDSDFLIRLQSTLSFRAFIDAKVLGVRREHYNADSCGSRHYYTCGNNVFGIEAVAVGKWHPVFLLESSLRQIGQMH